MWSRDLDSSNTCFFEPRFYRTRCQEVRLGSASQILAAADPASRDGATYLTRLDSTVHRHIRRNTATTLPTILARSPEIGV